MFFLKKYNIVMIHLYSFLFLCCSLATDLFPVQHGQDDPSVFKMRKNIIENPRENAQIIRSPISLGEQKDERDRQQFAQAISVCGDEKISTLKIIIDNSFDFLPLDDIKNLRYINKDIMEITTALLRAAMRGVIVCSDHKKVLERFEYKGILPNVDQCKDVIAEKKKKGGRDFYLHFKGDPLDNYEKAGSLVPEQEFFFDGKELALKPLEQLRFSEPDEKKVAMCTQFVKKVIQDVKFIVLEIDSEKFSHTFLKNITECCNGRIENLENCTVVISHLGRKRFNLSIKPAEYLNTLFSGIKNNKNKNDTAFVFDFNNSAPFKDLAFGLKFALDNFYINRKIGPKDMDECFKGLCIPDDLKKTSTIDLLFSAVSFAQTPSLNNFLVNTTVEKLVLDGRYNDFIDISLAQCITYQKNNLKKLDVCFNPLEITREKTPEVIAGVYKDFACLEEVFLRYNQRSVNNQGSDDGVFIRKFPDILSYGVNEKSNTSIETLYLENFFFSNLLAEYFLKNLKNLKNLTLKNCAIEDIDNLASLKDIDINSNIKNIHISFDSNSHFCERTNRDLGQYFFSVDTLKTFFTLFPQLETIDLNVLLLHNNADLTALLSMIKKITLREKIKKISISVYVTQGFMNEIIEHIEDVNNEFALFNQSVDENKFSVKIRLKDKQKFLFHMPLSIVIEKNDDAVAT